MAPGQGSVPRFSSFKTKQPSERHHRGHSEREQHRSDRRERHHSERQRESSPGPGRRDDNDPRRDRSPHLHRRMSEVETRETKGRERDRPQPAKQAEYNRRFNAARNLETMKQARTQSDNSTYFRDVKGDADNVRYGSIDRYRVPVYTRMGSGFVVGAPSLRIDRAASTDTRVALFSDGKVQGRRNEIPDGLARIKTLTNEAMLEPVLSSRRNEDDATQDREMLRKDFMALPFADVDTDGVESQVDELPIITPKF